MPIPPMLEEGSSLGNLEMLADRRDDDLCDIGSINPKDEGARMQRGAEGCQEYGQLYLSYTLTFEQIPSTTQMDQIDQPNTPLDDLDTEELLIQTMTDRERLTELGKQVGVARYALEGHDTNLQQQTKLNILRTAAHFADKYPRLDLPNP